MEDPMQQEALGSSRQPPIAPEVYRSSFAQSSIFQEEGRGREEGV